MWTEDYTYLSHNYSTNIQGGAKIYINVIADYVVVYDMTKAKPDTLFAADPEFFDKLGNIIKSNIDDPIRINRIPHFNRT